VAPGDEAVTRRGVRLGVDVGTVRVGVARSDPDALLAMPVATLARVENPDGPSPDVEEIARLADEHDAVEVVVGLPLGLSGREGPSARAARGYAEAVARRVAPIGVRLVDERLSTVTATRSLRDAGRRQRRARPVVDQVAAVVILQAALDAERASGRPPGLLIALDEQATDTGPPGAEGTDVEAGS
jgi:putative Holliday junction resolvase